MRHRLLLLSVIFACLAFAASAAPVTYNALVDTSSIAGTTGSLDFQFDPGPLIAQSASLQILNFISDGTLTSPDGTSRSGSTYAFSMFSDSAGTMPALTTTPTDFSPETSLGIPTNATPEPNTVLQNFKEVIMYRKLFNIAKLTFLALAITTANALAWTPFIDILSPPSAAPGSGSLSLTIHGANFIPGAYVNFNGVKLTPDSLTISQLHVTIPAASLATAHTANVTVVNPDTAPLDGSSNVAFFPITIATPSVSIGSTYTITDPIPNDRFAETVAVGDFNGDGKLDLAIDGPYSSKRPIGQVSILLGDGAGNFTTASIPSTGVVDPIMVTGDFNGDGILDLAFLGGSDVETLQELTVLLGDGTGQFTSVSGLLPELGGGARGMVTGDFNGDGRLDLAVVESFDNLATDSIHIFTNVGGGHFADTLDFISGVYNASLITGDFNGDGILDLILAGADENEDANMRVLLGDGAGNLRYGQFQEVAYSSYATALAAGDFNGDGKLDVAIGIAVNIETGANDHLLIFLNDGTGSFTLASSPQVGEFPFAVVTADFNGDGKLDLAAASSGAGLTILLGDGLGNFIPVASPPVDNPYDLAIGDFKGTGRLDFVLPSAINDDVSILFDPALPPSVLDVTSSCSIVSTGLIYSRVTQSYHGTITVTNTGTQTYTGPLELTFQNLPSGVSLNAPAGTLQGAPYLNLPGGLAPGQSVSLTLQFSDPANTPVTFTNQLYAGTL